MNEYKKDKQLIDFGSNSTKTIFNNKYNKTINYKANFTTLCYRVSVIIICSYLS